MSDEEVRALARRALESADPTLLTRAIGVAVRDALANAASQAEPRPLRGPWQEEERRHEMPPPRNYRATEAGWSPGPTRLRGVIAIDNEPLYDRIAIDGMPGEYVFFEKGIGMSTHRSLNPTGAKTRVDTNVRGSGRLPEPESFEVKGVSLVVRSDAPEDFVEWLRHETYFELRIGGTMVVIDRQPTWCLTGKHHRTKTGAVLADELYPDRGRWGVYEYPPDVSPVISLNEGFQAVIVVGPRPGPRAGEGPEGVRCILHGYHGKGVRRG